MSKSRSGIYEAGVIDPGLPKKPYSEPFWLSEPSEVADLQSPWLDHADVVIIGSGMTAVSLCRSLLQQKPNLQIVVLEAREVCSGATGRNGGHCKAMSPGVWFDRKRQFGIQEAIRIMEFEHSHLAEMASTVEATGVECDFRTVEGLDVYHDPKVFQRARDALDDMGRHSPKLAARYTLYTSARDLIARNLGPHVLGAIGMPAGTVWPYKFVTGLFRQMLEFGSLHIQTSTTVLSIDDHANDTFATVHTTRGSVRASQVIHAANSWTGHLLPELRPHVSPVRANVQRQVARYPAKPQQLSHHSFWLRYAEKDYDYVIQRPDGAFILGRANTGRRATADDNALDLAPHSHLQGATPLIFDLGTRDLKLTHRWSGAVAFTDDHSPFVGKLPFPGREHQWICAAYQGIGMVAAFRSAQNLAALLLGKEVSADFPTSWLLTMERVTMLEETGESKKKGSKL